MTDKPSHGNNSAAVGADSARHIGAPTNLQRLLSILEMIDSITVTLPIDAFAGDNGDGFCSSQQRMRPHCSLAVHLEPHLPTVNEEKNSFSRRNMEAVERTTLHWHAR